MNKNLVNKLIWSACFSALALSTSLNAQVNSGSDGSDGALNPTSNLAIDMADRPDGIYHYTSVNIPADVTVSFIPNAGNKPVVWLVQNDCVISGTLDVAGQHGNYNINMGLTGGPGGGRGGNGGSVASPGQGPGGGPAVGSNASYATVGQGNPESLPPGNIYGNTFILPLLGGSGGGGWALTDSNGYTYSGGAGGGGGGALLIAASGDVASAEVYYYMAVMAHTVLLVTASGISEVAVAEGLSGLSRVE